MVLLIVSILLTILAIVTIFFIARGFKANKALSLLGLVFLLMIPLGMVTSVDANSVGIIFNEVRGGIQDSTYGEGVHGKSIFEHITVISTANRSASVVTTGQTNDGQYATFEISIIYKIKKEDAGKFFRVSNISDIPSEALETIVRESLQKRTIGYNIFELLSEKLEECRSGFETELEESLYSKYFVTLVSASFDDIDGGPVVEGILQDLAKAEQLIAIALKEAEAAIAKANGSAEAQMILADAAAYEIEALGEANAGATTAYIDKVQGYIDNLYTEMNGTMTYQECADLVLGIIFYETWNGELPQVLTSDSLSALIGGLIQGA